MNLPLHQRDASKNPTGSQHANSGVTGSPRISVRGMFVHNHGSHQNPRHNTGYSGKYLVFWETPPILENQRHSEIYPGIRCIIPGIIPQNPRHNTRHSGKCQALYLRIRGMIPGIPRFYQAFWIIPGILRKYMHIPIY